MSLEKNTKTQKERIHNSIQDKLSDGILTSKEVNKIKNEIIQEAKGQWWALGVEIFKEQRDREGINTSFTDFLKLDHGKRDTVVLKIQKDQQKSKKHEELKQKTDVKQYTVSQEMYRENGIEYRNVTLSQAVELLYNREPLNSKKLVIYRIKGAKQPSLNAIHEQGKTDIHEWPTKSYIAVHGTGYYLDKNDLAVDISSLHTLYNSAYFSFLVAKNGMIFQSFDENKGYGGVGTKANENMKDPLFSIKTIAIEISARENKERGGVEAPNALQIANLAKLVTELREKYGISKEHVFSHADVNRNDKGKFVSGSHTDDIPDELRSTIGMLPKEKVLMTLKDIRNINKYNAIP